MSSWSIDFSPMVPAPVFWAGAVLAAVLVVLLLLRRSRGALLRALSLAALLLALANPTLRQEERESLANIAIVVVDESLSQTHRRPARADGGRQARAGSQARRHQQPAGALGASPPSPPASRRPAPTCSPTSTARSPTRRPTGWPASS